MNAVPFWRRNCYKAEAEKSHHACVSVQYFTLLCSSAQLQSSGSFNSFGSLEVLGFPSSLSYFSTYSLLSPHTPSFILSFTSLKARRAMLYKPRSLLWGSGPCVGWWGSFKGKRKRAASWVGHRQLGCGGRGAVRNRTELPRGLLNMVSAHPSPSSFGELLLQPSLGAPTHIESSLCLGKGGGHRLSLPGDLLSRCGL